MDYGTFLANGVMPVQLPDPAQQMGKMLTLAQLARQNRVDAQKEQDYMAAQEDQKAAAAVFADAQQMGWDNALRKHAQVNPRGAQLALKIRREDEGAQVKVDLDRSNTAKNNADAVAKAYSDIGNAAFSEAQNPDHLSLSRVHFIAKEYGRQLPEFSGDPQNPDDVKRYLSSVGNMAYSAKDQVSNAETGRHNRETERLTGARDAATAENYLRVDQRARDLNAATQANAAATRDVAKATALGPVGERTTGLRKEFAGLPQVKNYLDIAPVLEAVKKAPNTPQGDLQLIYGVGKIMDPGSVVREGEMALVIKSGSPQERIEGFINYLRGGGQLSPKARARLTAVLENAVGERRAQYEAAKQTYSGIAQRGGISTDDVFAEIPSGGASGGGGSLKMVNGVMTYVPNAR